MILSRFEPYFYAMFRIVTGFLFLWHGSQKLLSFPPFPANAPQIPSFVLYGAGPIELVGGILVMLGLFTNWVAFLCSGLMAFAYFIGHYPRPGFLPLQNGGELAVIYCFLFLFMSARGSGIWSLDSAFGMAESESGDYAAARN